MELAAGRVVGKYQVDRLLGRGGMASVWRVRHADLGTPYALKVMEVEGARELERFRAEGRLMGRVRHPNVLGVVDVVDVDGHPGLVLEYVDGPPLDRLVSEHRFTPAQLDEVARGLLKGVRAAHRAGIIHRDLKPANVLMARADDRFVPKVADFGLATAVSGDTSMRRTRTGMMLGTPAYMAPEQFRDAKRVDGRADVYALGVMLYELCTGRLPYEGRDLVERFDVLRNRRYPTVAELRPDLPPRMGRAIEGAMAMEPADRIASVDLLFDAWAQRVEEDEPTAPWDTALLARFDAKPSPSGAAPAPQSLGATYALDDSAPPSGRPSPWLALTGLGVGAAGLALVAAAAAVILGVAAAAWLSTEPDPERAPGGPAPAAAPAPALPAPALPAPAVPVAPLPPPVGAPEPAPPAPADPPPRPRPAPTPTPAPQPTGHIAVGGKASFQLKNARGEVLVPGALPPGHYVLVRGEKQVPIELQAGQSLHCNVDFAMSCVPAGAP